MRLFEFEASLIYTVKSVLHWEEENPSELVSSHNPECPVKIWLSSATLDASFLKAIENVDEII